MFRKGTAFILSLALMLIILSSGSVSISAASEFEFKGSMSESVLKNYLSRAVTFQGLCAESDNANFLLDEDIRMILRTGSKFISRAALFAWSSTNSEQVNAHYKIAEEAAKKVHSADPEIILQGFVAEIVRKNTVNNIPIPSWVFEDFGDVVENRNFKYADIIDDSKGADYWGKDAGYPDYSKREAQYWYYYCIRRYIDAGYESIHIQEHDEKDTSEIKIVDDILTMSRKYAKEKARRGIVLFHSFFSMAGGGAKIGDRLVFDIHGNGLVPNETEKVIENGEEVMKSFIFEPFIDSKTGTNYWCTWFGRSRGGQHPLGFSTDIAPTILEFDNYGQQGELGTSNGPNFGTWGYDDITWFAVQPETYRNEFLLYLYNFMKNNGLTKDGKQAYFTLYPMRRVITAAPNWPEIKYSPSENYLIDFLFDLCSEVGKEQIEMSYDEITNTYTLIPRYVYRANRQTDGCPTGFNQEDTIRRIFLGEKAEERPEYNKVVYPEGYLLSTENSSTNNDDTSTQTDNISEKADNQNVTTVLPKKGGLNPLFVILPVIAIIVAGAAILFLRKKRAG